jgi:hypothetical protein
MPAISRTQRATLKESRQYKALYSTEPSLVARRLLLATVAMVGPNEGLQSVPGFVSRIGNIGLTTVDRSFSIAQRQEQILEMKLGPISRQRPHYPPRFEVNPLVGAALEIAHAGSYRLADGRELDRDRLAEWVELQLEIEAPARILDQSCRAFYGDATGPAVLANRG